MLAAGNPLLCLAVVVDVGESHFGGFVKKSPQDEGAGNEEQKRKTHSEIMKEVVAQSKAAKFQRQEVKREVEDLLEEVDSQWRVVQSLVVRDGVGQGTHHTHTHTHTHACTHTHTHTHAHTHTHTHTHTHVVPINCS